MLLLIFLKMFNIQDKNIIVTGASSGLGQHIAEFFASHGANIIICARRAERLEQLQQKILPTDTLCEGAMLDKTKPSILGPR